MKKKRFTEEQIIRALKEHEAGAKVADICRRVGISDATFYNWRSQVWGPGSQRAETAQGTGKQQTEEAARRDVD